MFLAIDQTNGKQNQLKRLTNISSNTTIILINKYQGSGIMNIPYVMKRCTKCGRWLVASKVNFNKCKKGKYGLQGYCRECNKNQLKQYCETNKEKILEQQKQYRENNKDKIAEKNKRYRENNKDKIVEYRKKYHKANRDKENERNRRYYEANRYK